MQTKPHPAKFSKEVLRSLEQEVRSRVPLGGTIVDPFAGVGGVHYLYPDYNTIGIEIEPEWVEAHERNLCGNSLNLSKLFEPGTVDAIVTSPAYGNRMADQYAGDAKKSKRYTYRTFLGRELDDDNAAKYNWSGKQKSNYQDLHFDVWCECCLALRDKGWFFLNISNHIRGNQEVSVVEWHIATLANIGLKFDSIFPVETKRLKHGANHQARVSTEKIVIFQKA